MMLITERIFVAIITLLYYLEGSHDEYFFVSGFSMPDVRYADTGGVVDRIAGAGEWFASLKAALMQHHWHEHAFFETGSFF